MTGIDESRNSKRNSSVLFTEKKNSIIDEGDNMKKSVEIDNEKNSKCKESSLILLSNSKLSSKKKEI